MKINNIEITRSDVLYVREFGDPDKLSLTIVGTSGKDIISLDASNHAQEIEKARNQLIQWGFMR